MKIIDVIWNKIELSAVCAIHNKAKLKGRTIVNSHKVKSTVQKMKMVFGEMDIEAGFFRTGRGMTEGPHAHAT